MNSDFLCALLSNEDVRFEGPCVLGRPLTSARHFTPYCFLAQRIRGLPRFSLWGDHLHGLRTDWEGDLLTRILCSGHSQQRSACRYASVAEEAPGIPDSPGASDCCRDLGLNAYR